MEPRVAIVLSGGGAKGAYEAGALSAIVQHTQDVHIVTGASIGAINAAVFACEYDRTGDIIGAAQAVRKAWYNIGPLFRLKVGSVTLRALWSMVSNRSCNLQSLLGFASLVDTKAIQAKVCELIPDTKISDLTRVDLAVNATDLTSGKTVAFTRDNDVKIRDAVMASSAIPILFPPVNIDGEYYVDGGIFNNTPLKDAITLGATHVFIIGLKPKDTETYNKTIVDNTPFTTIFGVGARLMELVLDKIMYEDLKTARRLNKIVGVIRELEKLGNTPALEGLKEAIGYHKHGRTKSLVEFYDIGPSQRLDPPGTLGFDQREAILAIMEMGQVDAQRQLADLYLRWAA